MQEQKPLSELEQIALASLGSPPVTTHYASQVRFQVTDRGSEIVLGVVPQFTTVTVTPELCRDLARSLIEAAERAENAAKTAERPQ